MVLSHEFEVENLAYAPNQRGRCVAFKHIMSLCMETLRTNHNSHSFFGEEARSEQKGVKGVGKE